MSEAVHRLEVKDSQRVAASNTAVAVCRRVTRSRPNGMLIEAQMVQVITVKNDRIVGCWPVSGTCLTAGGARA